MIRPSRSLPPRPQKRASEQPPQAGGEPSLRLAVTRGGLGLELSGTYPLGALTVTELAIALTGLSFPLDLSGGVPRFRHRRGVLERLVIAGQHERLAGRLAPRLRGVLGPLTPSLSLSPIPGGIQLGLHDGTSALVFDALWAPRDGIARFVVANARGIGLGRPAMAAALAAADGLVGRAAERKGALYSFPASTNLLLREVLPSMGARLPASSEARWGSLSADAAGWRLECDRTLAPPELDTQVVRELELARLASDADDALAAGDYERARELYVALLERAPRHPSLTVRIAEIDRYCFERIEAALATLREGMPLEQAGGLAGELLLKAGEPQMAHEVLTQAAEAESFAPLAALLFLEASRTHEIPVDRLDDLDKAIARAPALAPARWARFETRLELRDFRGAMADLEHIEAATRGPAARHEVFRRAGEAFLAQGHDAQAATIFERALRYAPDSPQAVAGLAKSLLAMGRKERALELFARAIELSERTAVPAWDIVLELAHALAEAGDLPAAIARVRTVPVGQRETLDARGLEARWRARLGDVAGASIAFVRLREWIESATELDAAGAARWLAEAARFERETKRDAHAAQAYLDLALRLAPHDDEVNAAVRAAVAKPTPLPSEAPPIVEEVEETPLVVIPRSQPLSSISLPQVSFEDETADDSGPSFEDEQRVEMLEQRLRADPQNHRLALELADLLAKLKRDLDLFALLSARLEEATSEDRADLVPRQKAVLERLIETAQNEGREDEASLYRFALERLD